LLDASQLRALPPHCAWQGGVSKAFSSPKPMFIQTGVQLTVSSSAEFQQHLFYFGFWVVFV
jgi:hypothetical protein